MRRRNTSTPKASKHFMVWDEAPLHKPARARYMELRKLLINPNPPSKHITTAQLADVISGSEGILPPEWAADSTFEAELESLINNHSVVLICWNCDSILSFIHDPELGKMIVPELALVQQSEQMKCPYCGSDRIANYDPKVLTLGEKIEPQDTATEDQGKESPPPDLPSNDEIPLSANEQFLDKVLRSEYDPPPDGHTDTFKLSSDTLDYVSKLFADTVSGWGHTPDLPKLNPNLIEHLQEHPYLPLRVSGSTAKPSSFGQNWLIVRDILGNDYPDLGQAAVGMSVSSGLSASAHLGKEGEMAVVIELGLFAKLPRLNHLLSRLFDGKNPTDRMIHEIVINVISNLIDKPVNPDLAREIPRLDYQNEHEFLRASIITDAQIVFAILHELGHLADWRTSPNLAHHVIKDPVERAVAIEAWADSWAMQLILQRGKHIFIPWMQYRAIFWIFEYWHLMAVMLRQPTTIYCSSRSRWDLIEAMLRETKNRSQLDSLYVRETRAIFDMALKEMEVL